MKTRACVYDSGWYAYACIFLGRWSTVFIIFSKRSLLGESFANKNRIQLLKLKEKEKRETTRPVKQPPYTFRETETLVRLKQGKGTSPRSQLS